MFFARLACLLLLFLTSLSAAEEGVSLRRETGALILSNGLLSAVIRPENGDFRLEADGVKLVDRGYWSQVGRRTDGGDVARLGRNSGIAVTLDPETNDRALGEVALTYRAGETPGTLPCEVELRYTLLKNSRNLYVTAVWKHGPGMPGFSLAEGRHAMKLNPEIFDWFAVDGTRHGPMPSGADWDRAEPLNLKEARRILTGPLAGRVEHKYGYSALIAQTPAYGWASSSRHCGVWLINPSAEYLAGGPTKLELTGHLDVNPGGVPVLLNMWHGSHYGGSSLTVKEDETWSKVIGPFAVHCNHEDAPELLRDRAQQAAAVEKAAWPYPWLKLPEYPDAAARGKVRGTLRISGTPVNPGKTWIGLAAAPVLSSRRGRNDPVDWQRNSRDYQFWGIAGTDGGFTMPGVRPGSYTLYAFGDGIPGEFVHPGVSVTSGGTVDIGTLPWEPEAGRRLLWQIGIADRTAREFRHGAEEGSWGRHTRFPGDFPQGVDYTVGVSDWSKDWNYVHCGVRAADSARMLPVTWRIHFQLPEIPATAVSLRLGIAGNRSPEGVLISVNGQPAGGTGPMPDTAVMHRDAVRGRWLERTVPIPANLLRTGENTLSLTVPVRTWADGVLYDFVRLEAAR